MRSITLNSFGILAWVGLVTGMMVALLLKPTPHEVVAEQPPVMMCQYSAGYGRAVYAYEMLDAEQNLILTDTGEVFSKSLCEKVYERK